MRLKMLADVRELGVVGALRKRFGKEAVEFQVISESLQPEQAEQPKQTEVTEKKIEKVIKTKAKGI